MNDSIRLGRIAGIPIGLNWTWAIVFAFFTWSLASNVFPAADPGLGSATYAAMGVAAGLLFFASLLLHELGHAVVARREGMAIDGITLWLFGGVARFRGSFPRAGVEFRVAIAGPAVTAGLALAFVAAARLTGDGGAIDAVVSWLGYVNLLLLGFNLLPAFPLDGGRVLRSAIWRTTGNLARATRIASLVGRGVAIAMIAVGLALFLRQGGFGDLWLALIGWFLLGAAKSETRVAAGRGPLDASAPPTDEGRPRSPRAARMARDRSRVGSVRRARARRPDRVLGLGQVRPPGRRAAHGGDGVDLRASALQPRDLPRLADADRGSAARRGLGCGRARVYELADRVYARRAPIACVAGGLAWGFVSFVFFWDVLLAAGRDGAPLRVTAGSRPFVAPNWVWILGFALLGVVTGVCYWRLRRTLVRQPVSDEDEASRRPAQRAA